MTQVDKQEQLPETIELAVFPIPDCVVFPNTVFPLHVFEPRYRKMIDHCLQTNTPLAIAHTQKILSPAKQHQDLEEILSNNQATYQPVKIFSAGEVEWRETFDDGRMRVNLHTHSRVRMLEQSQTIPFIMAKCEVIEDEKEDLIELEQLKQDLLDQLRSLFHSVPELSHMLEQDFWDDVKAPDLCAQLFQIIRLPADFQQQLLECRSPAGRIRELQSFLQAAVEP